MLGANKKTRPATAEDQVNFLFPEARACKTNGREFNEISTTTTPFCEHWRRFGGRARLLRRGEGCIAGSGLDGAEDEVVPLCLQDRVNAELRTPNGQTNVYFRSVLLGR